jgi:hypothetical protein
MKRFFNPAFVLFTAVLMFLSGCTLRNENPAPVDPNPDPDEIAPSLPQNRNVLLEEYPGTICGYSPDGDVRAKEVYDAFPGRVAVVAIHAGYFATPQPANGYPDDYRTTFGQELLKQTGLTGIPAGAVNRHYFSGGPQTGPYFPMQAGSMALQRNGWMAAAREMLSLPAPVNIGVRPSWDAATRMLTIAAETYYTAEESAENFLNIALIENGIMGAQADFQLPPSYTNKTYIHNNVLRHLLTGQWGEKVIETNKGDRQRWTFFYQVSQNINIDNCKVALFVTQGRKEVLNVLEVSARP